MTDLEQQIAAGAGEREAAEVVVGERRQLAEVELAAVEHLDLDPLLEEVLAQPGHGPLHLLGPRAVVRAHVRRGGDRGDALGGGAAGERPRVVHRPRPVVEAGEDVRVEVDQRLVGYGCRVRPPLEQAFPRPSVLGVVNVTPDSFSDGGRFLAPEDAVAQARRLLEEGAALVDVGAESTRPGSAGVSAEEELRRLEPVLERLSEVAFSVDTSRARVARRALDLGAVLVNDVTALRGDPELAGVVAESGAYVCLMHMLGEPRTMQDDPRYDDVVAEVKGFLEERLAFAVAAGIAEERVCLDPGIGFGKTVEHNLELLARLDELVAIGRPVLVGASRKRFLGRLLGDPEALTGPVAASVAVAVLAFERGASLFRAHDVREHVEALAAARAVVGAEAA